MNRRRFLGLCAAGLLVALVRSPARADTVDDLVGLIREAGRAGNPAMAFIRGLGGLGDFTLGQADIRRALREANAPTGGMIEKLLAPTQKITKKGGKVSIERSQETTLSPLTPDGNGAVKLGRKVSARVSVTGAESATIDDVSGIEVGEQANKLYDLDKVRFVKEGGRQLAKVTASWGIFSKTVTIDITPKPVPGGVVAGAPSPTPTPTVGLTGAVDDATAD